MSRQSTRLSRTMLCGAVMLVFAAMMVIAGCSSDDDPAAAPAPVITDPAQGMQRMEDIARNAADLDIGDLDDIALDDEVVAGLMDMLADLGFELPTNGGMPIAPSEGEIDEVIYGLHVRGSWLLNEEAMNLTANLRVSGTLQDTDSEADGTATDVTVTVGITGGNGTINVGGWVTPPGEARVNATLRVTISDQGSDKRVRIEATATQSGMELLFADVTVVTDPFAEDASGTINGTVRLIDPDYPPHRATITFTNLQVDADGEFVSGQVVLNDSAAGLTATLSVQPDGSLSGPVRDHLGNIVGHMTVVGDQVTVTPV